ncbi:CHASE2 domain-containing protein [Maribacter chungangensis]|uniref:CHASE2 domain-containing protein n=1 Tax=Maribacter chungangensis TaxID=1069117 RepID=A0ABW3AYA4_9FLAO
MRRVRFINRLLVKEAFFCMLFSFMVIGLVLLIGLNISFFSPFKNAFKDFSYLDLYYAENLHEENGDFNENIVLVNINRINRKEIAELLGEIQKHGPKVIGLDVIFKDSQDPVWDQFLAEKLKNESLVLTYTIQDKNKVETNAKVFSSKQYAGYSNFNFDTESLVIRNFQGIYKTEDDTLVSFPVAVTNAYLENNWLNDNLNSLKKERPIKFWGNRDRFLVLEQADVIGRQELSFLKDRIVLLGYLGDSKNHDYDIEDKHYTPMNPKFVGKNPPDTFGLVIHANIIQMLLANDYISIVPTWVLILLTIVLTFMALAYFIYLNKRQLASYILRLNLVQLFFIILFIWISLLLFKNDVLLKVTSITATVVFSMGLIGYYKKLANYLYKRYKWEGYFYHD